MNLSKCYKFRKQGPNVESHIYDKTGKSKVDNISFWFDNNDVVLVSCYYWSDEIDYLII